MANMVPSRFGQVNGDGDARALFLKLFSGLVLAQFSTKTVARSRQLVRSITSGKSAQFPVIGKGGAGYHTPGVQLVGTGVPSNERVISLDDALIADRFVANIDEAISHFEIRSEYAKDAGDALAQAFDRNSLQVMTLAARAGAAVSGGNGGTVIEAGEDVTDTAASLVAAIATANTALDEKDVPEEDRACFLRPAVYQKLIESGHDAINADYNREPNGSIASGKIFRIGGTELVKTNNLPNTDVDSGPTGYQGDFTDTVATVAHRSAAGVAMLWDIATEMEYLIEYQGTLLVAKMAVGHGILRPESAVEIQAVDPESPGGGEGGGEG